MAPKNTDHTRKTETLFGEFINKATYAALADITDKVVLDGGKAKYNEATHQTYANLILSAEDRDKEVKSIFTVATEIKQFFRMIFSKITEDFKEAGPTATDTLETFREKLVDDSYLALILDSVKSFKYSKTLSSCVDTTMYLSGRLQADLGNDFVNRSVLVVTVAQKFYDFVRRYSYEFARLLWYTDGSMNENNTLYLFEAMFGFGNDKIAELKDMKRPKSTKPTTKKKTTDKNDEKTDEKTEDKTDETSTDTSTDTTETPVDTTNTDSKVLNELGEL